MRIDKANEENLINYHKEGALHVSSEERAPARISTQALQEKNLLPVLYKPREILDSVAYVVNLSYRDGQFLAEEQPALQGVFEEDTYQGCQMRHDFSSWQRTVSTLLGRDVKEGLYVDKVV